MKKIADPRHEHCFDPEHNPPMHISLRPGTYAHICPTCRRWTQFTVTGPVWA